MDNETNCCKVYGKVTSKQSSVYDSPDTQKGNTYKKIPEADCIEATSGDATLGKETNNG